MPCTAYELPGHDPGLVVRRGGLLAAQAVLAVALLAMPSAAAICPVCVGGYTPVRGLVGAYAGDGASASLYYDYHRRATLYKGGARSDNPAGLAVTVRSVTLGLDYGLAPRWILGVLVPWVHYEGEMPGPSGGTIRPETSGVGDTVVQIHHSLWGGPLARWRGSASLGVKTPTGATGGTDPSGKPLPITAQAGSGSWDGVGVLSVTRGVGQWTFLGEANGRVNTRGQGVKAGDAAGVSVSAGRTLVGAFLGVADANWSWQAESDGDILSGVGTGGWTATGTFGLQWIPSERSRLEIAVRKPFAARLNGDQLGVTLGISIGGRLYF